MSLGMLVRLQSRKAVPRLRRPLDLGVDELDRGAHADLGCVASQTEPLPPWPSWRTSWSLPSIRPVVIRVPFVLLAVPPNASSAFARSTLPRFLVPPPAVREDSIHREIMVNSDWRRIGGTMRLLASLLAWFLRAVLTSRASLARGRPQIIRSARSFAIRVGWIVLRARSCPRARRRGRAQCCVSRA